VKETDWEDDVRADSPSPENQGSASAASGEAIAVRYGRTASGAKKNRLVFVVSAAAFAVVLVAWVVWAGLDSSSASFEAKDTGHTVVDAHSVSIDFTLTAPPGTSAACALQAQSETFSIVGWKVVEIPASTERTRGFTQVVRTTEMAVTGLIYRCWLT
jgi:hypothetical protein